MNPQELQNRTKDFAKATISVVDRLPNNIKGKNIANQLFRCSTSVAANYRAACRARSKAEFIAKLGIVLEEVDEAAFWLELILELRLVDDLSTAKELLGEAKQLTAIVIASINSAKNTKP